MINGNVFYSWNTTKVSANNFKFEVYKVESSTVRFDNGTYRKDTTVKTGFRSSRAKAKRLAQKWVRFLNQSMKAENKARLEYANEDAITLTESGAMAITDTKLGVVWMEYKEGVYIGHANHKEVIKTESKSELISFISNLYITEVEA